MKLVSLLKRDEAPITELKDDGWSHGSPDSEDELDTSEVTLRETQNAPAGRAPNDKLAEEKAPMSVPAADDDEDMIVEV